MHYHFELYILSDQLLPEHWAKLYKALVAHLGLLSKFEVSFRCTDNVVRFFVACDKDISSLSNTLEAILLRPIEEDQMQLPTELGKERNVSFVTGGNLLDLKEKYAVKKSKDLQYAVFHVNALGYEKAIVRTNLYFKGPSGSWTKSNMLTTFLPIKQLTVDFATNTHYLKKTVPKYLNIEKSLHMLSSSNVKALFKVSTFPYFAHDYYLNLASYEFDKHSFIIGASGSGKSKLISLFVDRLQATALKMNYRVVIIDPHASLAEDFEHLPDTKIINFKGESTELFSGSAADITAATELTTTLFKSLMDSAPSPKLDRVLRFSLFVLFTAQNMSLDMLKRFLTDIELRNQIVEHVAGFVPSNVAHFFGADFNEMRTKYQQEAISPIVSLVDEMQLQPMMVNESEVSLAKTVQDNFLTVFSLNKVSMGEKVVKTVAGLLIQQIFLLAQARAFGQKVILIIDEVSVVQNPALASILAEARKFNLSVILTQQYFGQIEKDLQDAIFANVYNYYTFKVSEEDARALEGNMNIELPKEIVEAEHKKGLKEQDIRIKIMTQLHPRECLVRVLANGQVVPAVKARTMDVTTPPADKSDSPKLQAYKQMPIALPEKFSEQQAGASRMLDDTPLASKRPANASPMRMGALALSKLQDTNMPPPPQPKAFNLSELLAQQSSSRQPINKRKDN